MKKLLLIIFFLLFPAIVWAAFVPVPSTRNTTTGVGFWPFINDKFGIGTSTPDARFSVASTTPDALAPSFISNDIGAAVGDWINGDTIQYRAYAQRQTNGITWYTYATTSDTETITDSLTQSPVVDTSGTNITVLTSIYFCRNYNGAGFVEHALVGNSDSVTDLQGSIGGVAWSAGCNPYPGPYEISDRFGYFAPTGLLYSAYLTNGFAYFGDRFGIGSTSPYSRFAIHANPTDAYLATLFTIASSTETFSTTTLFTILANGKVGIGTTTPYAALSVVGSSGVVAAIYTATSTTATSTFANGVNLTGGCYAYTGICLTAGLIGGGTTEATNYATAAVLSGTPTYGNGSSGVGATLTEVGFGAVSVDGSSPGLGDRILVKNQASALENGIYTVTTVGSGIGSYVLTRATDYNSPTEITPGINTYVISGTANSDTTWALNYTSPLSIGSSNLNYTESAYNQPLAWTSSGHTGTVSTFAGFNSGGTATNYTEANYLLADGTRALTANWAVGNFNLSGIKGASTTVASALNTLYVGRTATTTINGDTGTSTFTSGLVISSPAFVVQKNTGNIGINILNPASRFHLDNSSGGSIQFGGDSSVAITTGTSGGTFAFTATGNLGVGTSSPKAKISADGNATTTIFITSSSITKGACLVMKDIDGVGVTYITANNGVLTAGSIDCR